MNCELHLIDLETEPLFLLGGLVGLDWVSHVPSSGKYVNIWKKSTRWFLLGPLGSCPRCGDFPVSFLQYGISPLSS